jgi:hypothetical protein
MVEHHSKKTRFWTRLLTDIPMKTNFSEFIAGALYYGAPPWYYITVEYYGAPP